MSADQNTQKEYVMIKYMIKKSTAMSFSRNRDQVPQDPANTWLVAVFSLVSCSLCSLKLCTFCISVSECSQDKATMQPLLVKLLFPFLFKQISTSQINTSKHFGIGTSKTKVLSEPRP